jgi:acyl-CoA synthetase (AMP-forming)/AMP-acid ligase II
MLFLRICFGATVLEGYGLSESTSGIVISNPKDYTAGKWHDFQGWPEPYIRIYMVYVRYFWHGNHQIYGRMRCIYTVLANPNGVA